MTHINGISAKEITSMMNRTEKLISFYNKKYNFDLSFATQKEVNEYEAALRNWDFMKSKRDQLLKQAA